MSMSEKLEIKHKIANIKVEQFALFEDNYSKSEKLDSGFSVDFGVYKDAPILFNSVTVTMGNSANDKPFSIIEVSITFEVDEEDFNKLKRNDKIIIPFHLAVNMTSITIGTIRGVFFEKTSNAGFPLKIIPGINLLKHVPNEDIVLDYISQ